MLIGALNMGEYAYDFTVENVHDGPSRNPHDPARMTGGSSGGSGSAVAGRLVPLALGSDTNGSIRVPASLCGGFGLKPTYGRLPRARTLPFVASLDPVGPVARSVPGAKDLGRGVRDRLIAGAMGPAAMVVQAQKFRRWYQARVLELFREVDAVLLPATPCTAPRIGQDTFTLDGVEIPVRANLGLYTQPISFIGLPVVAVPVPLTPLPIGVQIAAAPWREDVALRIAYALEGRGAVGARNPAL